MICSVISRHMVPRSGDAFAVSISSHSELKRNDTTNPRFVELSVPQIGRVIGPSIIAILDPAPRSLPLTECRSVRVRPARNINQMRNADQTRGADERRC